MLDRDLIKIRSLKSKPFLWADKRGAEMKLKDFLLLLTLGFSFVACAGDDADLEEARYYLGKGGSANAEKALSLVESKLTSSSPSIKIEAHRLYAGAKMTIAGFDSLKILSNLVYREGDDSSISTIRPALTIGSSTTASLLAAEQKLSDLITNDADYTASTDVRAKNGIIFQLGLVHLFQGVQGALESANLQSSASKTLTKEECIDEVNADNTRLDALVAIRPDLSEADSNFSDAGLDSQNKVRKMVTSLRNETPDVSDRTELTDEQIAQYCEYISSESSQTQAQ